MKFITFSNNYSHISLVLRVYCGKIAVTLASTETIIVSNYKYCPMSKYGRGMCYIWGYCVNLVFSLLCMEGIAEFWQAQVLARFTQYFSLPLTGWGSSSIAGFAGKSFFKVGCFVHLIPKSRAFFSLLEKRDFRLQMDNAFKQSTCPSSFLGQSDPRIILSETTWSLSVAFF